MGKDRTHRVAVDSSARVEPLERRRLMSAGSLDPSFGRGGIATTGSTGVATMGEQVAVLGDGKTLVAGWSRSVAEPYTGPADAVDFVVRRFNADGSPDPTFGTGGAVTTDLAGGADQANALLVLPDGRFLLGGSASVPGDDLVNAAIVRYLPDGQVDTAFGDGGRAYTSVPGGHSYIERMALTADGKIVTAGTLYGGVLGTQDALFLRFNADGSPDATFGSGGRTTFNLRLTPDEIAGNDYAQDLAIRPDGRIVGVGGTSWPSDVPAPDARGSDYALFQLNADGTPDETFAPGGAIAIDRGGSGEFAQGLALAGDGSVFVVGRRTLSASGGQSVVLKLTAAGVFDDTFAGDGQANVAGNGVSLTQIALAADGGVVVAGMRQGGYSDAAKAYNNDWVVRRFTPAGEVDATFNGTGSVTVDYAGAADEAAGLAIAPGGQIVVSGTLATLGRQQELGVVRFNADGSRDATFSGDGIALANPPLIGGGARAVARQPDGKLLIAGSRSFGATLDYVLVTRLNPDGSVDGTFGTDGATLVDVGVNDEALAVAVLPNGQILVGATSASRYTLVRFDADGGLDATFGTGGTVAVTLEASGSPTGMAVQPDGKIVMSGSIRRADSPTADAAVVRFNADGTLDAAFGTGGYAVADFAGGADVAEEVAVQADGKLLVAGYTRAGAAFDLVTARFNADGTLDGSYGTDGRFTLDLPRNAQASALALQPDGRAIVAGQVSNALNGSDHLFVRLTTDGTLDPSFNGTGFRTIANGTDASFLQSVAVDAGGNVVAGGYIWPGTEEEFLFVGLSSAGEPDAEFGADGVRRVNVDENERHGAVLVQPDGRYVLVGQVTDTAIGQTVIAAIRVEGMDPSPPPPSLPPGVTASAGAAFTYANGTLTLTGGTLTFAQDNDADDLSVVASGANARLVFGSKQELVSMTLQGGARATVNDSASATSRRALVVESLSVDAASTLDLGNNLLVYRYTGSGTAALAQITDLVKRGFNGGDWGGTGIASGAAFADPTFATALGVADNAEIGYTDMGGETGLTGSEILVRYTYYGDADLSGGVDNADLLSFQDGLLPSTPNVWLSGDFDFDVGSPGTELEFAL